MRRILWMTIMMMVALAAKAQQKVDYTINGISKDNGYKVFLIDRLTNQPVDSTVVVNGKFQMKGSAEKDAFMAVGEKELPWMTLFFNDGTPVTINLNDSTLKGSPVNERLVGYDVAVNTPYSKLMMAVQELNGKQGNMTEEELSKEKTKLTLQMVAVVNNMGNELNKIFKEESGTMIPAAFISEYQQIFGQEKLDEQLSANPVYASHPIVKQMMAQQAYEKELEAKKTAFIGKQFTDLEEADVDGKMHKLSEYVGKGKWVLVDFWASWCGPCLAEMPNVVKAYELYHAKGFDIVGLSFDNKKEPWVKAIADQNMPWIHLSDLRGWRTVASGVYAVNSIPDNLLIDPQGKIVARGLRAEGLQAKLKEIFE